MTSEFRLFTRESVAKAKEVVENPDGPADPEGGGGFAEWAMLTLQALRIELRKSYRQTIDLLSEMPGILDEIGLIRLPQKRPASESSWVHCRRTLGDDASQPFLPLGTVENTDGTGADTY